MATLHTLDTLFDSKLILSVICILLVYYVFRNMTYYAGTPPGPWGIPLFGYMYFLSKKPYVDFTKMAKKYGEVFAVKIGVRHVIVLNDYDAIKEAFANNIDVYSGKPRDGVEAVFGDHKSVFVTDGELWREQRRFLLSSMRNSGFGKNVMEENLRNEAEIAIQELENTKGLPYNILDLTSTMTCNSIAYLVFGRRFSSEDDHFVETMKILNSTPTDFAFTTIADAFPLLDALLTKFRGRALEVVEKMKGEIYSYMDKFTEEHKQTFDENYLRDVTDSYLEKNHSTEKKEEKFNKIFTKEFMRPNLMLLFAAGTDTTSHTISWALKLLAEFPEFQKRIHDEIDDVIGRSRAPTMADKIKMPFTDATILEVYRYSSLVPLTFNHRITDDAVLRGFKIPKNAFVIANLWNNHFNPDVWKEPNKFNPGRFIDENGKISNLREKIIPFSIGSRKCLGESLARTEIFIFLVSFLQKFTFKPPTGENWDLQPEIDIPIRRLLKYNICAVERE